MAETKVQDLCKEILEFLWAADPVTATGLGIHKYDHHYADYSDARRKELLEQKKLYLDQLNSFHVDDNDLDTSVDLEILKGHLSAQIYNEETQQIRAKNPALYPNEALMGVQQLQINYAMPIDQRVTAIIGRLKDMPRLLEQGMHNLQTEPAAISRLSINVALDALQSGKYFLEEIVPQFSGTVPLYFKELLDSNTAALKAMHKFENFLHHLLPQANASFAAGTAYYNFLLKEKHRLNYTIDEVIAISQNAIEDTERLLNEVANDLDADHDWQTLVEQLKNRHPKANEVLHYYKAEAERIRDFMLEEELFNIPDEESETLMIMETPIFQRNTMPFSGYVSPAPFEEHQIGHFWITPVSEQMDAEEKQIRLRAHNVFDVVLTNVHHAYPGQHLLFVRTNQHPSRVRKSLPDAYFAEGWPLYCEEMLYTEGLYSDLKTRLFQLKDQLWREYRTLIDAKLHKGEMSYEEAIEVLKLKVGLDSQSAEAEVKRYSLAPSEAVGYLIGKQEIIKLRQEVSEAEGDDFSLARFHDNLLSFGMIPFPLLRKQLYAHYKL